jgi:hypothetical protein
LLSVLVDSIAIAYILNSLVILFRPVRENSNIIRWESCLLGLEVTYYCLLVKSLYRICPTVRGEVGYYKFRAWDAWE